METVTENGCKKCPSIFFILRDYIEQLYIYLIYICIYILIICHQHFYGFQNLMSSWEWWSKFSKFKMVGGFTFFGSKSSLFRNTNMLLL